MTDLNTSGSGEDAPNLFRMLRKLMLIAVIFIAAIGIFMSAVDFSSPKKADTDISAVERPVSDPFAGKFAADSQDSPDDIVIPGWGKITVPAGITKVKSPFYNPSENPDYLLTFQILLQVSEGEYRSVYLSDYVPGGEVLPEIELSEPLEKGTYNAVVHIQPYRVSDLSPANNADIALQLIAE